MQQEIEQELLTRIFKSTRVPRTVEKMEEIKLILEEAIEDGQKIWSMAREICWHLDLTPIRNRIIIYDLLKEYFQK